MGIACNDWYAKYWLLQLRMITQLEQCWIPSSKWWPTEHKYRFHLFVLTDQSERQTTSVPFMFLTNQAAHSFDMLFSAELSYWFTHGKALQVRETFAEDHRPIISKRVIG